MRVEVLLAAMIDAPDEYNASLKVVRDTSSTTAVCSPLPEPKLQGDRD